MSKEKKLQIRNSTAEFLIFTRQAGEGGIEVRVAEETVWLTQKLMAALFEVPVPTINEHLANLYSQGGISETATVRNSRTVQKEGARQVTRNVEFYNLDAIIAVGFRVNSARAIQLRQWATRVLRDFAIRGYGSPEHRSARSGWSLGVAAATPYLVQHAAAPPSCSVPVSVREPATPYLVQHAPPPLPDYGFSVFFSSTVALLAGCEPSCFMPSKTYRMPERPVQSAAPHTM